jgi:hypothetical protein
VSAAIDGLRVADAILAGAGVTMGAAEVSR